MLLSKALVARPPSPLLPGVLPPAIVVSTPVELILRTALFSEKYKLPLAS